MREHRSSHRFIKDIFRIIKDNRKYGEILKYHKHFSTLLWMSAVAGASPALAQATLASGFGGPAGYGTTVMAPNDDGSSASIPITTAAPSGLCFFGNTFTSLFVNNNGNITFGGAVAGFTPTAFPASPRPMIAPLWLDVDTRDQADPEGGPAMPPANQVYFFQQLNRIVATWHNVGYFANHNDKRNDFQVEITNFVDQRNYDIIYRYAKVDWTTGDASGGAGGLGGVPGQVGFDAGDRVNFVDLPVADRANHQPANDVEPRPGRAGRVHLPGAQLRRAQLRQRHP
jgi:hypothetical protein